MKIVEGAEVAELKNVQPIEKILGNLPTKDHPHYPVRLFAKKVCEDDLRFSSEQIGEASNCYVAWLDLMGAGHIMGTSVHKSANFLVRLHMAVETARMKSGYQLRTLPINDGIFIISSNKGELMTVVRWTMVLLSARFIGTPRPHDRCLMKGAIAFGPVYSGGELRPGISNKKLRERPDYLERVWFGPPIIQAYKSESSAPPYGIAIHESARAFSTDGNRPFQMTHWLWWQDNVESKPVPRVPSLTDFKDCLSQELQSHLKWMDESLIFHGVPADKINAWSKMAKQYFSMA
jgi:hypothetical protein